MPMSIRPRSFRVLTIAKTPALSSSAFRIPRSMALRSKAASTLCRVPVALPGTPGAHGKPRLLVYQTGVENAFPCVHIKLPAHSPLPPQNPQTQLIRPFVIGFCIVKKSIAPVLPVAIA
jgi:hypothetical protein